MVEITKTQILSRDSAGYKPHPTISVCMIVKDEEEFIAQCLGSIKHFVDEIIMVDTGSKDKTVEIAKSFGATLYHQPWENDFSKHRNQSISYATGDWFWIIDADEELVSHNLDVLKLKNKLAKTPQDIHALLLTINDRKRTGEISSCHKSPRLFRNGVGVHYRGIIHNQPVIKGRFATTDMVINHYGYDLEKEKMEEKKERTTSLLFKRIETNPKDWQAYFYLSTLYAMNSDLKKATEYGEKCMDLIPNHAPDMPYFSIYFTLGTAYNRLNDCEKALKWIRKGLKSCPEDPDLHFAMMESGVRTFDNQRTIESGQKYLSAVKAFRENPGHFGPQLLFTTDEKCEIDARFRMMIAYLNQDQWEYAEDIFQDIGDLIMKDSQLQEQYLNTLWMNRYDKPLWDRTILFLRNKPTALFLIDPLVLRSLSEHNFDQTFKRIKSELNDCCAEKALTGHIGCLLIDHGSPELSISLLDPLMKISVQDVGVTVSLSRACEKIGNHEKAMKIYQKTFRSKKKTIDFFNHLILQFKNSLAIDEMGDTLCHFLLSPHTNHANFPQDILIYMAVHTLKIQKTDAFFKISESLFRKYDLLDFKKPLNTREIISGYQFIAHLKNDTEDWATSLQCYEIVRILTKNLSWQVKMGDQYLKANRPKSALKCYKEAIRENYLTPDMIDKMKQAFLAFGNIQGIDQCNQLRSAICGN